MNLNATEELAALYDRNSTQVEDMLNGKIVLCGIGRFQMDVECIFDSLDVVGYLDDTPEKELHNGRPVFDLAKYSPADATGQTNVVICAPNGHPWQKILEGNGWRMGENCFFAEDMFPALDPSPVDISVIPVCIWGTGDSVKEFFRDYAENWGTDLRVECYIDNDISKNGSTFLGKPVVHPSAVAWSEFQKKFILVASSFYADISRQLKEKGLHEYQHFMHASHAIFRPSAMMRKLVSTPPRNGPMCNFVFGGNLSVCMHGVFPCICARYLKLPIGNILTQTPDAMWRSNAAKIFRLSIINHAYCFCHMEYCALPKNTEAAATYTAKDLVASDSLDRVEFAFDDTCNLSCPSCRPERRVLGASHRALREAIADRLLASPLIQSADSALCCGGGEVFASPTYKRLVYRQDAPKRRLGIIQTNLQLFSLEKFEQLKSHFEIIHFTVSVDGVSKDVYERLRRGASWEKLCENMEVLASLRRKGQVSFIRMTTVVQRENYKEIPEIVSFAKHYAVDELSLAKVMNWGTYSEKEFYENVSMFERDNITIKKELLAEFDKVRSETGLSIIFG